MARWFSKRWVWAALAGATFTLGMSAGSAEEPPKVGSTISLPIDGKTARQFKVLKSEKQPDGTYLSELKDINSGETLTFLTRPNDEPLKSAPSVDDGKLGKAKAPPFPMPSDPPKSDPPKSDPPKEKDKHPFLSRIFGDKEKDKTPTLPVMPGGNPPPNTDSTSDKKPGLFARIFGPKKPTGPSMPAASMAPVIKPSSSTPPPVLPVPQGGLSATAPAFPATGTPPLFPNSSPSSTEPPRVMPSKPQSVVPPVPPVSAPVVPTAPAFPAPTQVPAFPAPTPVPAPLPVQSPTPVPTPVPMPVAPIATPMPPIAAPLPPLPAPPVATPLPTPVPTPAPVVPPLPVPLPPPVGESGLPPVPVPPGGTSAVKPLQIVVPAGYVPPQVAFDREVQPFVIALQTMTAPSARLTAAKGLADSRHCSTDGVKSVLFQAAQLDPCGEVRAACITHLCDLGYFAPHFLSYIQTACEDTDPLVRSAAKTACEKMIRK